MAGAQAADLPVKATPVQYVKICSLYGAGFFYIPGTDTCIKIGGFIRAEVNVNAHNSFNPIVSGGDARFNRNSDTVNWRARGVVTFDTRSQTEYGTLRSYIAIGEQANNGASGSSIGTYSNRMFIQWAGFTAGLASSYFDFYVTPRYSNTTNILGSDTGGSGDMVFAYTAQLGNGLSATLSAENPDARRTAIYKAGTAISPLGTVTDSYAGLNGWPDIVANLRIDQAWGSAQIMGAVHQVAANYYGATEGTGHPDDKLGWAVGAGLKLNSPWAKGDSFTAQVTWAQGALSYVGSGLGGFAIYNGADVGVGYVTDAVYSPAGGDLELTEGWSVVAGADHHWSSQWKTSLYGGYGAINYNGTATSLLNLTVCGTAACGGLGPDFSFWQIGTRTVWTPVKNLDLSVDVLYNRLQTSYDGATAVLAPGGGKPTGPYHVSDQDVWQVMFRAQRNFWP
jgi:hypothetical protein